MTERDEDGPWFEIGTLQVTTTILVLLVWAVTVVIFAIEPVDKPIMQGMALIPDDVATGEVWRLFTWPWSHSGFGLFDIINAAVFWLFGTELEKQIGRKPFAILIGSSILIIGLVATILSVALPGDTVLADLELITLTVVLLYIAEHPTRPFFFGIPAWAIGAVIVAIEVVNDLAYRDWIRLLSVVIAAALIALVARKLQLLTMYDKVPDLAFPGRKNREGSGGGRAERKRRKGNTSGLSDVARSSGLGGDQGTKKRGGSLWGKRKEDEPAEIVQMPQPQPRRRPPIDTKLPEVSADDLALDALLDKIADGGLDALTPAERQELTDLRERRRSR
jgi:membrane associated rhomboid family serine protease